MAKNTTAQLSKELTKENHDLSAENKQLRETIRLMDAFSHDCLSEIAAIAKLGMSGIKGPDGLRDLDSLFHALGAIYSMADDTKDQISGVAGDVGCNHENEAAPVPASADQEDMSDYDTHAATADALMHSAYLVDREVEATFDADKLEALREKRRKLQDAARAIESLLDAEDGGSFNATAWEPAALHNYFANA
jgi:hypothetical protein